MFFEAKRDVFVYITLVKDVEYLVCIRVMLLSRISANTKFFLINLLVKRNLVPVTSKNRLVLFWKIQKYINTEA